MELLNFKTCTSAQPVGVPQGQQIGAWPNPAHPLFSHIKVYQNTSMSSHAHMAHYSFSLSKDWGLQGPTYS